MSWKAKGLRRWREVGRGRKKLEGKKKVRMRKLRENCEKGHVFMVWGLTLSL